MKNFRTFDDKYTLIDLAFFKDHDGSIEFFIKYRLGCIPFHRLPARSRQNFFKTNYYKHANSAYLKISLIKTEVNQALVALPEVLNSLITEYALTWFSGEGEHIVISENSPLAAVDEDIQNSVYTFTLIETFCFVAGFVFLGYAELKLFIPVVSFLFEIFLISISIGFILCLPFIVYSFLNPQVSAIFDILNTLNTLNTLTQHIQNSAPKLKDLALFLGLIVCIIIGWPLSIWMELVHKILRKYEEPEKIAFEALMVSIFTETNPSSEAISLDPCLDEKDTVNSLSF